MSQLFHAKVSGWTMLLLESSRRSETDRRTDSLAPDRDPGKDGSRSDRYPKQHLSSRPTQSVRLLRDGVT